MSLTAASVAIFTPVLRDALDLGAMCRCLAVAGLSCRAEVTGVEFSLATAMGFAT
jgi:hypothetical protein